MDSKIEIDRIIKEFFDLFTTKDDCKPKLDHIYELCIPQTTIIKNVDGLTEIYDLKTFIAPRKKLLSDGSLIDFSEYEIQERTDIFGNIAQRFCIYEKTGTLNDKTFIIQGLKTFQFIKMKGEWKISSMAWDDENDNQKIDMVL
ncbi:MAG: hypothetical protein R8N23_06985 [Reichenbachiella sp.]|uniref:hypothetical protein n=1 Tax=Reichenbachiella sp. TaxID=2184521 RepID=UPI0029668280|nr:hypothetical protein [Reichenbachiella sp.]MDW3209591.1 hypothetical protein [Reichenbachiella sp.]